MTRRRCGQASRPSPQRSQQRWTGALQQRACTHLPPTGSRSGTRSGGCHSKQPLCLIQQSRPRKGSHWAACSSRRRAHFRLLRPSLPAHSASESARRRHLSRCRQQRRQAGARARASRLLARCPQLSSPPPHPAASAPGRMWHLVPAATRRAQRRAAAGRSNCRLPAHPRHRSCRRCCLRDQPGRPPRGMWVLQLAARRQLEAQGRVPGATCCARWLLPLLAARAVMRLALWGQQRLPSLLLRQRLLVPTVLGCSACFQT